LTTLVSLVVIGIALAASAWLGRRRNPLQSSPRA
jgi:hypothetical protein